MAAIAKWGFFRMLAAAPGNSFCFSQFDFHWGVFSPGMRSITKRLSLRSSTTAPIVFAWLHFHHIRHTLWNNDGITHAVLLKYVVYITSVVSRLWHSVFFTRCAMQTTKNGPLFYSPHRARLPCGPSFVSQMKSAIFSFIKCWTSSGYSGSSAWR